MLESYKKLKIASAKISQMKEIMFNKDISIEELKELIAHAARQKMRELIYSYAN